jgi:amino acid transporter
VNFAGIRFFGEFEFWLSSVKVVTLIGLILLGIMMDAGANPSLRKIGFNYYQPPNGPFGSYLEDKVEMGINSRFFGVCSAMSA